MIRDFIDPSLGTVGKLDGVIMFLGIPVNQAEGNRQ